MATLESYVDHARLFGTECVYETAEPEFRRLSRTLWDQWREEGRVPLPVDLAWVTPAERERIFDQRESVFAQLHAEDVPARELERLRVELDRVDRVPSSLELRVAKAVRLHREGRSVKEIAFQMQVSPQTAKKYLSALPEPMEESGVKVASPARKAGKVTGTPASTGNTVRTRKLAERIAALHEAGLVPAAIADRLGKSDATVRRYLRRAA